MPSEKPGGMKTGGRNGGRLTSRIVSSTPIAEITPSSQRLQRWNVPRTNTKSHPKRSVVSWVVDRSVFEVKTLRSSSRGRFGWLRESNHRMALVVFRGRLSAPEGLGGKKHFGAAVEPPAKNQAALLN
jgi:hypothetical protein